MNLKHGEKLDGNLLFPNVAFCMSYKYSVTAIDCHIVCGGYKRC